MLSFDQNQSIYMLNFDMLNTDRCKKPYHKIVLIYHLQRCNTTAVCAFVYQDTYKISISIFRGLICLSSQENPDLICLLLHMLIGRRAEKEKSPAHTSQKKISEARCFIRGAHEMHCALVFPPPPGRGGWC